MKAIILAGGEGTRLRPLSLNKPKPMIRLFDRPLLEHTILLLRRCGFTELCITLHYLPRVIQDYFGDGSDLGVSIEYRTEAEAAGTAGGLRACADFAGNEDFLVISGDAACSYDLRAMMEKHRLSGAEATILVQKREDTGEFGLVLTEDDGRIRSFVEKPGPEQAVSDLINTGIYAFSPSVLSHIPEGRSADFGADIFPRMLRNRCSLHVWQAEGYWNDVGTCDAYLATCRDVLSGRFPLPLPEGGRTDGAGRCWISPEANVAAGAELGPWTVIGAGSTIADGCRISDSAVDGAAAEAGCVIEGSILARGAHLGREVRLQRGCVLAEGVTIGSGAHLRENVRVWPGLQLPGGCVLSDSLRAGGEISSLRFQPRGMLRGENSRDLTPEKMLRMGGGCGGMRIGAAASGGGYARLLSEAFLIGAGASGKRTYMLDASLPASAAAAAGIFDLDMCLFFRQEGRRSCIHAFDRDGLPLPRKEQRKLEAALCGASAPAYSECCHAFELLTGSEEAWIANALEGCGRLQDRRIACSSGLLRRGLSRAGAEICAPEDGIPELRMSEDGFTLSAIDEKGRVWSWSMLLCALTEAEFRRGEKAVVLPYDAPNAAERIAEKHNGTIYRLERDGKDARRLLRESPWCSDGLRLSLRLLTDLALLDGAPGLADLMNSLPDYHTREQVIPLNGTDAAVLRRLSGDQGAETVDGVRLHRNGSTATVRRLGGSELRILVESSRMEAADELCDSLRRRIRQLDGENTEE